MVRDLREQLKRRTEAAIDLLTSGRYADARKHARAAVRTARDHFGLDSTELVRPLLVLAEATRRTLKKGGVEASRALSERAIGIAQLEASTPSLVSQVLRTVALIEWDTGDRSEAIRRLEQAIEAARGSEVPASWLAFILETAPALFIEVDPAKARTLVLERIGKIPEYPTDANRQVALWLTLGHANLRVGDEGGAERAYMTALGLCDAIPPEGRAPRLEEEVRRSAHGLRDR